MKNEEIKKLQASINAEMKANSVKLSDYLKTWDQSRVLWEINKDQFIQRYRMSNPSVSTFDADIGR